MDDLPPSPRSRFDGTSDELPSSMSARSRQLLATFVDEHVNLKSLHRKVTSVSRVLVTITFAEDAWRMVSDYSTQAQTMSELVEHGNTCVPAVLSPAMPIISALVQVYGTFSVVLDRQAMRGCTVLLLWCILHPFVYGQQRNYIFMSETITVVGGLLILMAHIRTTHLKRQAAAGGRERGGPSSGRRPGDGDALVNSLSLCGRILITAYFVLYAFLKLHSTISSTNSVLSIPSGLLHGCVTVVLFYLSLLVILGAKSRRIAVALAAIMFCTNLYWHPFWLRLGDTSSPQRVSSSHLNIVLDGATTGAQSEGPRKAMTDQRGKPLPLALQGLAVMGTAPQLLKMQISLYDHERYFFFMRLSTVGALLLLAVHGPGRTSVDESKGSIQLTSLTKGND